MKKTTALMLSLLLTAPVVYAGHRDAYDFARVISAEPITKTLRVSTPVEECWDEQVRHHEPASNSSTPMIVGAIVGGLLGNELGHHKDAKNAGIAAGAVLGGSIGRDLGRRNAGPGRPYYTSEQVCRTYEDYHEEERIAGYHVTYRYHGRLYHTRMREHPGKRIRVEVAVKPAPHWR